MKSARPAPNLTFMQWAEINGIRVGVCGVKELPAYADQGVTHLISIWQGSNTPADQEVRKVRTLFREAQPLVKIHRSLGFTQISPTEVVVVNFRDPETALPALRDDDFATSIN